MSNKLLSLVMMLILLAGLLAGCGTATAPVSTQAPAQEATAVPEAASTEASVAASPTVLRLATTTSTEDSGLLDYILPDFESANNATVDVVAVGTGQALEIGGKGDADVVLVHSRKGEDQFVADGNARERFDVMYNDFIFVGPKEDPAKIAGTASSADALKAIAESEATFVSRGDKSGTNTKELSLWSSAGITPTAEMPWYKAIGQGMGETLLFANEEQAYTLTDRGTYLSMRDKLPDLAIAVGGENLAENTDKKLLNPYGVLAVNPDKHPGVNFELATKFVEWLLSPETQEKIAGYGVDEFGQPLFYPNQASSSEAQPTAEPAAGAAAGLKITGKVANEMSWTEEDVRAMPTMEAHSTNKADETKTYTGVSLKALLDEAGVASDATTLVFVTDDGSTAEASLAEVMACADCVVSFREQGGFSTVLPGFPSNLQVKGVVEIQVK
jgi:tungstate transport system substrate-binding protein